MKYTLLLLCLLACVAFTTAAPDNSTNISTDPVDNFPNFVRVDKSVIREDDYFGGNMQFTIPASSDLQSGNCDMRGSYDSKKLTTATLIQDCYDNLRDTIVSTFKEGASFYINEEYYDTLYPYCWVKCTPITSDSSSSAILVSYMSTLAVVLASAAFAYL